MGFFQICISILLIAEEGVSEWTSKSKLTWMDAQLFCSERNSSLIQGHSQRVRGKYWTGEYQRLSSWMHIIGCYSLYYLRENADIRRTLNLSTSSLGLCQESCLPVNVFAFSIKNNKCLCLGKIPKINGLSPMECDGKCREIEWGEIDSFPNDCGSSKHTDIYNVYATSSITTPNDSDHYDIRKLCIFLWTAEFPDKYEFIPMNCDCVLKGGLCQGKKDKNEFFKIKEYSTWRDSLDRCKTNGSYLLDISTVIEAKGMISRSTYTLQEKTSLWHWIGIARQIYLSSDTGISLDNQSVIRCKKCDGSHCNLTTNCDNDNEQLLAVCSADQRQPQDTKDVLETKNYNIVILLSLIGCFIVLSLVTLAVCYIRRRNGMKAEKDSSSINNSSQYTSSPKHSSRLKAIITSKFSFWNDTSNCQDNFSDVSSVVTVVNLFKNRSYGREYKYS